MKNAKFHHCEVVDGTEYTIYECETHPGSFWNENDLGCPICIEDWERNNQCSCCTRDVCINCYAPEPDDPNPGDIDPPQKHPSLPAHLHHMVSGPSVPFPVWECDIHPGELFRTGDIDCEKCYEEGKGSQFQPQTITDQVQEEAKRGEDYLEAAVAFLEYIKRAQVLLEHLEKGGSVDEAYEAIRAQMGGFLLKGRDKLFGKE